MFLTFGMIVSIHIPYVNRGVPPAEVLISHQLDHGPVEKICFVFQLYSWESKVPPPKLPPPGNKALLRPN